MTFWREMEREQHMSKPNLHKLFGFKDPADMTKIEQMEVLGLGVGKRGEVSLS
jgi:hypothetical protein